jgi:hypothetical protein
MLVCGRFIFAVVQLVLDFLDVDIDASLAYEMTLAEGLRFERRIFHGLFATNDQKEGV